MKLLICLAAMLPAFILQAQISDRVAPPSLRPDFVFAVALTYSFVSTDWTVALVGLIAGILESSLAGAGMSAFAVSRVVATFFASSAVEPFNLNILVAAGLTTAAVVIAYFVHLLMQPTADLMWWLDLTIKQALVTAALVGVLVYAVSRIFGSRALSQPDPQH